MDEKPANEEIQVDLHRVSKFLGRVEPRMLYYLDENVERPNILRMFIYLRVEYLDFCLKIL